MAPILPKQSIDPALAVSKYVSSQPSTSQEDPIVLAQMKTQQAITRKPTPFTIDPQDLLKPIIPVVIQTPQQVSKQLPPAPTPNTFPNGQPILAGNVSPQSLESKPEVPVKLSIQEFAQKIKTKYPQYEDINDQDLVDKMISKYPTYIDMVEYDMGRQITQTPVPVAPQITYGENKIEPQDMNTLQRMKGAVMGGVSGLVEGAVSGFNEATSQDADEFAQDTMRRYVESDGSVGDEIKRSLLGGLDALNYVAQVMGKPTFGAVGGAVKGAVKGTLTNEEKQRINYIVNNLSPEEKQRVSSLIDGVSNAVTPVVKPIADNVSTSYNQLPEGAQEGLRLGGRAVVNILDIAGGVQAVKGLYKGGQSIYKGGKTAYDVGKGLVTNPVGKVNGFTTDFRTVAKDAVMTKIKGSPQGVFYKGGIVPTTTDEVAANVAKQAATDAARKTAKATVDKIGKQGVISKGIDAAIEQIQGVSKAQKQGLQNNPYTKEYMEDVMQKIDTGNAPQDFKEMKEPYVREITNKLDEIFDAERSLKSETGKAYKILRSDPTIYDTENMVGELGLVLKGTDYTLRTFLNKVDQGNLLGTRAILDGSATTANLHDIRKGIDDLIAKADANKDSGEFKVLTKMRKIVDSKLKENPNWKKSDEMFTEEMKVLNEIEEGITYRERRRLGLLKDNIDNILENINSPAKAQLKERLLKYMPDLSDRIAAIRAIPEIAKAYTSVPRGTASRIAGSAVGAVVGSTAGPIGTAVGIVTGFFTDVAMSKIRQDAIAKAVMKQSSQAIKRLEEINDLIKSGSEVSVNKIKELEIHLKKIVDDMNDPVMKAQMERMNAEILSKKIKNRSIVPVKEGQLKNNPANAMIYPKKPVVNVTEKGVATKPGTTKDIVAKLDQQIRAKKQGETPVKTVPKTTETKIEPKNLDNIPDKKTIAYYDNINKQWGDLKDQDFRNNVETLKYDEFENMSPILRKRYDKLLENEILQSDDFNRNLSKLSKEVQNIEEIEKRIGKVGKNTVIEKSYIRQQESERVRKKEKLIERISEETGLDQFEASNLYDDLIDYDNTATTQGKTTKSIITQKEKGVTEKVNQELQNIAQKVKEKRFVRDDLFADLGDARAEKAYSMVNKTNAEIKQLYNDGKLSDQDIKDIVRARQANAQLDYNERGIVRSNEQNQSLLNLIKDKLSPKSEATIQPKVQKELQSIAKGVKEKSLAKKENGSIMDDMKTTISDQIKEAKSSGKTFDEFISSKEKNGDILYHGTNATFDEFDKSKVGKSSTLDFGPGVYLTDSIKEAGKYADDYVTNAGGNRNIIKSMISKDLNIKKYNKSTDFWADQGKVGFDATDKGTADFIKYLKSRGYDGVSVDENIGFTKKSGFAPGKNYVIFDDSKIKTESQLKAERDKLSPKSDTPIIPKDLKPLYDEAKRYKSADEFMKNNTVTVHGDLLKVGDEIKIYTPNNEKGFYMGKVKKIKPSEFETRKINGLGTDFEIEVVGKDGKRYIDNLKIGTSIIEEINGKQVNEGRRGSDVTLSQLRKIREEANKS